MEVQSELGLLPSTSFYRVPSPVSSSGQASPDLEQQGNLMVQHKPFLKNPMGRASGMPPDLSNLPRLLPACTSSKLQPLSPPKPSRTHQILADVEKILGRASASSRQDAGHQLHQDATAEVRCVAAGVFSDSEPEDLDSLSGAQYHFQTPKEPSQSMQADNCVLAVGGPMGGSHFLESQKLVRDQGESPLEGSRCFQGPVDTFLGERAVGPIHSCLVRDWGFLHAVEMEVQLPPTGAYLEPLGQMSEPNALEGRGDTHSLGNGLRPRNSRKESRRRNKFSEQWQTVELSRSGRGTEEQGVASAPDPQLQTYPALGAGAGVSGDASSLLAVAVPRNEEIPGVEADAPGGGSSVSSSLADHLASHILGEVDNFSWDLQSSHETDHPMEQLTAPKRPFLAAVHSQTHSFDDDCSESECYSEDQKFYRHVLHMVKRSRGVELSVPEPLKRRPGIGQNAEPDIAQEGSGEAETKPQQGATAALEVGSPWSLDQGPGSSTVPDGQAEGEPVPRRMLTENGSGLGLSPEGDRGKEFPGPAAAAAPTSLGSLVPLCGVGNAPTSVLHDSLSPDGRSSVEPRALVHTTLLPGSCRRSLCESVDEAAAAGSLDSLMPDGVEKEEGSSESLRGAARLLRNLHVDVSALGASLDNEVSEGSSHMKELQFSDLLDPEPQDTVSPILEDVLDVAELPPVLGSPKFGVSRAAVESSWKEEDEGWLAQGSGHQKVSLELDYYRASAEAAERERSKSCPSASEGAEEKEGGSPVEAKNSAAADGPDHPRHNDRNVESEVNQVEPWKVYAEDSPDKVEQSSLRQGQALSLQHEKQVAIQSFQEQLWQEEREAIQRLPQQKEAALQTLKARQEEELLQQEKAREELQALCAQIHFEMEAEKERIRLAQETALQELREELESHQRSEEERLREQKRLSLERVKREAEAEQAQLERESQRALSDLKERLRREKDTAMQELEAQYATEIQQQRTTAHEEHQKVLSALQMQIVEAQQKEEAELQKELESAEQEGQQKRLQVAEYERELSDLLREKRQEVERDHARQLEKIQEAHREALEGIQAQHEEEERRQRAKLQAHLQEEREHLRVCHETELEALRQKQAEQLQNLRRAHQEEEEVWKKRKQQLLEEEKQLEQQRNEAALAACLSLEESRKEQESLAETTRQLHQALTELRGQKTELDSQVEQLQKEASELEDAIRSRQELLSMGDGESHEMFPRKKEEELRLEDLQESGPAPAFREMASEAPKNNEESSHLLDQVRHYISAEGSSLKTTKEFLARQTRSMRKRQTVLRAARQHWSHDLQDPGCSQVLEGVRRNLEEEARQLDEVKTAVRRGQALLKKKEERLAQLESSLLEEFSDEDMPKGVACKKVVTFDLSDSEDTSSVMSTDGSPHKMVDLKPELHLPPLDKIQCLTDSLQRITGELNRVLGLLSTVSAQQPLLFMPTQGLVSPLPKEGIPLATYTSLAHTRSATPAGPSAEPQWAWGLCSGPSPSALASQSVDSMLTEKWHKYFPGGFPLPCRSPGKVALVTPDDRLSLFPQRHFRGSGTEKLNIQGMIDANRKWLETVKQDSRAPLLPSGPKSSLRGTGMVQLGLDENNQITVYHF